MTGPLDLILSLHTLVYIPEVSLLRHTYLRLPQTWYINPFTHNIFHIIDTHHLRRTTIVNLHTYRASPTKQHKCRLDPTPRFNLPHTLLAPIPQAIPIQNLLHLTLPAPPSTEQLNKPGNPPLPKLHVRLLVEGTHKSKAWEAVEGSKT